MNIEIIPQVNTSSEHVAQLVHNFGVMNKVVPLSTFKVKYDAQAGSYLYRFTAVDGRKWTQHLVIPIGSQNPIAEYSCDFNTDVWLKPEFVPQRLIRDAVVGLIVNFGITEINVTF